MARAKQVHVVWNKKHEIWRVKSDGKIVSKSIKIHGSVAKQITKAEAVADAKKLAKELKCELTIHNKNGKISRKHSYGNDPRSSKG